MAFKDYSQGFENELTSGPDGSSELKSEKTISLYPGSKTPQGELGGDKIVWIRDGAKLVFEGRYPDDFEAKIYADTLTLDREILIQDKSGTIALLTDIDEALANATVSYTNTTPMPTSLGGFPAGTTFDNVDIEQMFTGLLYPYQYPSFSTFSISGQSTTLEVGDSIPIGDVTFVWSTTNSTNITADSLTITDVTDGTTLRVAIENDGIETILFTSPITKTTQSTNQWQIQAQNTQGSSFTRNYYVNWKWRTFYGTSVSSTLDESGVESLVSTALESNFSGNKTFAAGGYKYFAYPTSFGLKTTFKDVATGFGVAMEPATTLSITNSFGATTNYYVHRTTNTIVGAITIGVS